MPSLVGSFAEAIARSGVDLAALGLAWARALPAVTLVPAFGLKAIPGPARPVLGLAIAASVFPALAPVAASAGPPWLVRAAVEVVGGMPVAVSAAVPLWAATMAGGLADGLRGAQDALEMPTVEGRASPLGVLLSLLACSLFLATGGPARVALALAQPGDQGHVLQATAEALVSGVTLAVALGGPLLAASVVIEVAAALLTRATSPTQIAALIAPLRTVAILGVFAVVLERLAAWMVRAEQAVR